MLLFLLEPTKVKMTEREKEETRLVKVHIYLYSFFFINGYGALLVLTISSVSHSFWSKKVGLVISR